MHEDITLNGCECMVDKSTLCLVFDGMSRVHGRSTLCLVFDGGLSKMDNVQNESHGCIKEKENEIYVCWV